MTEITDLTAAQAVAKCGIAFRCFRAVGMQCGQKRLEAIAVQRRAGALRLGLRAQFRGFPGCYRVVQRPSITNPAQ